MESNVDLGDHLLSQAEIRTRAAYAAAGFRTLGVDRGDALALLLRNDGSPSQPRALKPRYLRPEISGSVFGPRD